ncbi:MAG: HWE histidine kinase domain-containing protein, partial [Pseudomonadota bacterium]
NATSSFVAGEKSTSALQGAALTAASLAALAGQGWLLAGAAGAIVFAPVQDRAFFVFRREQVREINWAGNPEKTIETVDNRTRLSPRGSFSTYLAQLRGHSKPWSQQDLYFSSRIWSIVNSVERREMITAMNRQQKIMIDELNHRVRNILALVRSVSQQARRSSYGSLESYSASLEARIQALAASHNLASGSVVSAVSVHHLIRTEFAPFGVEREARLVLSGEDKPIRAEVAPIFSLVIHELVTNAVKYGALSNDDGKVLVGIAERDGGLDVVWLERGGPPVVEPKERGFGSALISDAIPHELNGTVLHEFRAEGVTAEFHLPPAVFEIGDVASVTVGEPITRKAVAGTAPKPEFGLMSCLIVEDNFVIARGLHDQLVGLGVGSVEIASSVETALALLEAEAPDFALLDVNLNRDETSGPIAHWLRAHHVPFLFVTGYGDNENLPPNMSDVPRLTKPTPTADLAATIGDILQA